MFPLTFCLPPKGETRAVWSLKGTTFKRTSLTTTSAASASGKNAVHEPISTFRLNQCQKLGRGDTASSSHSTRGEAPGRCAVYKKKLRQRMIERAVAELTLNPSTIFNEGREKFLQEFQGQEDRRLVEDMLSDLNKNAIKKAMWRARQESIPKIPRNAQDALDVSIIKK